jgi:hypothetical protein
MRTKHAEVTLPQSLRYANCQANAEQHAIDRLNPAPHPANGAEKPVDRTFIPNGLGQSIHFVWRQPPTDWGNSSTVRCFTRALRDNQMVGVIDTPHLRTCFGLVTLIADVTVGVPTRRQEPITATHLSQRGAGLEPKDGVGPSKRIYAVSLRVHAPPIRSAEHRR